MVSGTRAGVEFRGTTLRYAEVEQVGAHMRLLRLGSCEFDFDAERELTGPGQAVWLNTIAEAVGDVFAGSGAERLHVALHPPTCTSFFAPVGPGTAEERERRLRWEAGLLAGEDSVWIAEPQPVRGDPSDGEEVAWMHVLGVRQPVQQLFEQLSRALTRAECRLDLSTRGAGAAIGRLWRREALRAGASEPEGPTDGATFSLAVGWYPSHAEFTLCRGEAWHFSHHIPAGPPADCAYFAAVLLGRLGLRPAQVGRLYLYGEHLAESDFSPLRLLFRREPLPLNPLDAVDLEQEGLTASFAVEAYAPCIGVTL